ncbi:MAG: hypothetical protein ACXW3U_16555, partial [Rhodoplanes sp.]
MRSLRLRTPGRQRTGRGHDDGDEALAQLGDRLAGLRKGDVAAHDGELGSARVERLSRRRRSLFDDGSEPHGGAVADELLRQRLYEARVLARRRSHGEAQRRRRRGNIQCGASDPHQKEDAERNNEPGLSHRHRKARPLAAALHRTPGLFSHRIRGKNALKRRHHRALDPRVAALPRLGMPQLVRATSAFAPRQGQGQETALKHGGPVRKAARVGDVRAYAPAARLQGPTRAPFGKASRTISISPTVSDVTRP